MHECSAAAFKHGRKKAKLVAINQERRSSGEEFRLTGLKRESPGLSLVSEEVKILVMSLESGNTSGRIPGYKSAASSRQTPRRTAEERGERLMR